MSSTNKILIVGCGAVGTMCAFAMQKSGAATVTAILRSNFDAVNNQGFHIESIDHGTILNWKPHNIVKSIEDAIQHGPFDFVLVGMKNLPDIYSIPDIIRPVVTPVVTSIVLVQNGIEIEQPFLQAFPKNTLLSGVTMVGCEQDGRDILHNDPDILYIAPFLNAQLPEADQHDACDKFAKIYELGGAKCHIAEDIVWNRWRKLVWNSSFNTVCALVNLDSGLVQDAGCLDTLIRPAMNEIVSIAKAAGYTLPSDIQDQMITFTPKEAYLKPSMQVDAIRGRPMEIEVILGNPLRIAEELDVQAPTLRILYELLKAKHWAIRNLR